MIFYQSLLRCCHPSIFFTVCGITIPDIVFSMTNGLSFASGFSSRDSSTIKRGKEEGEVSLSESVSEYERLDDFDKAMRY